MGAPITVLGTTTFPILTQGAFANAAQASITYGHMAGRQSPIMALFIPLFLVALVDGVRGLKQTWGVALTAGAVFAACQFIASNFIAYEVTDVIASVVTIVVIVVLLRFRKDGDTHADHVATRVTVEDHLKAASATGAARVWGAIAPYVIVVTVFALSQIPAIKSWLASTFTFVFNWPGLQSANFAKDANGAVVPQPLDFCGIVTAGQAKAETLTSCSLGAGEPVLGARHRHVPVHRRPDHRSRVPDGPEGDGRRVRQDREEPRLHHRHRLVRAGDRLHHERLRHDHLARLRPRCGRCGLRRPVSGPRLARRRHHRLRHVIERPLFGGMQVAAAKGVWPGSLAHEILMATSNSTGGVMGKMISPQSLSVAAAATGMLNQEGEIFRKVVGWSILLLAIFAVLVVLQSTILIGMVPVP